MGCGCKQRANETQQAVTSQQEANRIKLEQNRAVNENVKDVIKKTIEKYYNKGKK